MSEFAHSPVHGSSSDSRDEIPSPETPPHLRGHPFLSDLVNNNSLSNQQTADIQRIRAYVASSQHYQGLADNEDDEEEEEAEFNPGFEFDERSSAKLRPIPGMAKAVAVQRESNWKGTLRFVGLYMVLPFVTGVMAGLGEIFANEVMYRWGWRGARPIQVPGRGNRVFPLNKEKAIAEG
ncbi:hypothetical protein FB639_000408 [Coemansia asiatica]|nr:hypothetical protein FB639_000408 [Coemansia asiatica]